MALALIAAAPVSLHGQSRSDDDSMERPEVVKLELKGAHAVETDDLRSSISTDESGCRSLIYRFLLICAITKSNAVYERAYLDRDELARDVLRIKVFYYKRGYRETAVDTTVTRVDRGQVAVRFTIREGKPTVLDSIVVTGADSILLPRVIRARLRLQAGDALNLFRLDSTVNSLRRALWSEGYADAEVDTTLVVNDSARTASLAIELRPRWLARVGSITVTGNKGVESRTILRSLTLQPGDLYRNDDVIESQRSLYESNLFTRAQIVTPPEGDSIKAVVVQVREAPSRGVRTSAGFNTRDFVQVDARYTHYNWFGGARQLDITAGMGNLLARELNGRAIFQEIVTDAVFAQASTFLRPTWLASADVRQPWFGSPRNTLSAGVFTHRRSTPGVVVDRGFGASAAFTRDVMPRSPLSLAYRFEITRVEAGDIYFCVNFGVCDRPNIIALSGQERLTPVVATLQVDRTNDPFSPTAGFRTRADVEHASLATLSDFRYNRLFFDGAYFQALSGLGRGGSRRPAASSGTTRVLAGRVRLGWVNPLGSTGIQVGTDIDGNSLLHPRKRFYAGGAQSVRGYSENQLGPRVLTIAPEVLRGRVVTKGDTTYAFCDPATTPDIRNCDANAVSARGSPLGDREFTPRPTGGNTLVEASLEYRFPVFKQLGGAVFIDGALVGNGSLRAVTQGMGAITPGFGVRYYSPVGPIRVDLGYNPARVEQLSVITAATDPVTGKRRLVELGQTAGAPRQPPPPNSIRDYSPLNKVLDRITLHLSIGQAF